MAHPAPASAVGNPLHPNWSDQFLTPHFDPQSARLRETAVDDLGGLARFPDTAPTAVDARRYSAGNFKTVAPRPAPGWVGSTPMRSRRRSHDEPLRAESIRRTLSAACCFFPRPRRRCRATRQGPPAWSAAHVTAKAHTRHRHPASASASDASVLPCSLAAARACVLTSPLAGPALQRACARPPVPRWPLCGCARGAVAGRAPPRAHGITGVFPPAQSAPGRGSPSAGHGAA